MGALRWERMQLEGKEMKRVEVKDSNLFANLGNNIRDRTNHNE